VLLGFGVVFGLGRHADRVDDPERESELLDLALLVVVVFARSRAA
jgi:hypothetical protein